MIPVFVGPSLPPSLRAEGPFDWRPPAQAGDVLALLDRPPARLCLIDGLFDACPAPWHKELLLLMESGTLVFGAASMGALRAAELHPFGMIGVGTIFRAYRDGRIDGDDEVALIHAPERLGWAPLTVPMIEVRATLLAACRARLIAPATARRIRSLAREIHFSDRDWPAIAQSYGADGPALQRLEAMHIPLKQQDALACLAAALGPAPEAAAPRATPRTCFIAELASQRGVKAFSAA
ncbi:MAG TPA: TfuA domain-containing protein [Allosphingosinicella sp.]|jgi:hypothetical protein|nr:TfuA domain-containing protein [Allosphingosinicella sp.]